MVAVVVEVVLEEEEKVTSQEKQSRLQDL